MPKDPNQKKTITLMLLQESLWKLEDRLNIFMESIADHEADLIRHKSKFKILSQRLDTLETKLKPIKNARKH
jgi:chromosome segregation ATPase